MPNGAGARRSVTENRRNQGVHFLSSYPAASARLLHALQASSPHLTWPRPVSLLSTEWDLAITGSGGDRPETQPFGRYPIGFFYNIRPATRGLMVRLSGWPARSRRQPSGACTAAAIITLRNSQKKINAAHEPCSHSRA